MRPGLPSFRIPPEASRSSLAVALAASTSLLLAACAKETDSPKEAEVAPRIVAVVPLTPTPEEAGSPWQGVEEVVVTGSGAASVLSSSLSFVAFDAAELDGLDVSDLAGYSRPPGRSAFMARAPALVDSNTERYDAIEETGFQRTVDTPLSTFSTDVDTASYSNVRRFLESGMRPPTGAVRVEEMINYFRYEAPEPESDAPFATELEIFEAPWAPSHRLVRIALTGRTIPQHDVPPRNLVFLVDVSGSMQGADRLGLVKRGLASLVETLRPIDRVALVVYAGSSGVVLPPTPGSDRGAILDALGRLEAGGSTQGAAGIELAYRLAREHFDPRAINRVLLATDGDFNVGVTSQSELVRQIEKERESGIFLTVLGVGRGNLNDAGMEAIADKGNGQYAYLDSPAEARRVLVEQAGSTLVTIAKDVKIQVEFNPARVGAYRLIGYENRRLADRDFNDDTKDAGEIGAGHRVTALYEVVPAGLETGDEVDPLRYQQRGRLTSAADSAEWLTLKVRYKAPDEDESRLIVDRLLGTETELAQTSDDTRFATAVALFGLLLQGSELVGEGSFEMVEGLASGALGREARDGGSVQGERGERTEFLELVALARKTTS